MLPIRIREQCGKYIVNSSSHDFFILFQRHILLLAQEMKIVYTCVCSPLLYGESISEELSFDGDTRIQIKSIINSGILI